MKVLGDRVLVEQIMIKKKAAIIKNINEQAQENFDVSFQIKEFGLEASKKAENEGVKIDDMPVFHEHIRFQGAKVITRNTNQMMSHLIVNYDDIIAIDNDLPLLKLK